MFAEAPCPVRASCGSTLRPGIAPRPARPRNLVTVPICVVPTILSGRVFGPQDGKGSARQRNRDNDGGSGS
jgi:hypothetical protein